MAFFESRDPDALAQIFGSLHITAATSQIGLALKTANLLLKLALASVHSKNFFLEDYFSLQRKKYLILNQHVLDISLHSRFQLIETHQSCMISLKVAAPIIKNKFNDIFLCCSRYFITIKWHSK